MDLENGFYWIRHDDAKKVAERLTGSGGPLWWLCGSEVPIYKQTEVEVLSPRLTPPA